MRYFLFTYSQLGEGQAIGNLYFQWKDFPSHKMLTDSAKEKSGNSNPVVFTSWNEFKSKEDYNCFMEINEDTPPPDEQLLTRQNILKKVEGQH